MVSRNAAESASARWSPAESRPTVVQPHAWLGGDAGGEGAAVSEPAVEAALVGGAGGASGSVLGRGSGAGGSAIGAASDTQW